MKRLVILAALVCVMVPGLAARADTSGIDEQILGGWQLKMTTPDGMLREPIVLIGRQYDRYVAWYVADDELQPLKNVRLDNNDTLVGTLVPKDVPDVTVTLEARLDGENSCSGVGKFRGQDGDSGSWEFSGTRLDPHKFYDVTKWTVEFTTPDYERHTATVLVMAQGETYHAWYSGKNHEVPVRELKVDGDRVVMKVVAETRDRQKVEVEFVGRALGETVEGDANYKQGGETGSFPFTAKQVM